MQKFGFSLLVIVGLVFLGLRISAPKHENAGVALEQEFKPAAARGPTEIPAASASVSAVQVARPAQENSKPGNGGRQAVLIRNMDEVAIQCAEATANCQFEGDFIEMFHRDQVRLRGDPQKLRKVMVFFSHQYLRDHPGEINKVVAMIRDAYPAEGTERYQFSGYAFWTMKDFKSADVQYNYLASHPEMPIPAADLAVYYYESGNDEAALTWEEKIMKGMEGQNEPYPDFYSFHRQRIEELRKKIGVK